VTRRRVATWAMTLPLWPGELATFAGFRARGMLIWSFVGVDEIPVGAAEPRGAYLLHRAARRSPFASADDARLLAPLARGGNCRRCFIATAGSRALLSRCCPPNDIAPVRNASRVRVAAHVVERDCRALRHQSQTPRRFHRALFLLGHHAATELFVALRVRTRTDFWSDAMVFGFQRWRSPVAR